MEKETQQFKVYVKYEQPSSYDGLRFRFPAFVNPEYDKKGFRFHPIKRCRAVSRESREITFELVHLGRFVRSTRKVLIEMEHRGLRPALYEEFLKFVEKYPQETMEFSIVVLGSETRDTKNIRYVACLDVSLRCRVLMQHSVRGGWDDDFRFLAVRE